MKRINQLLTLLIAIVLISSCKKDEIKLTPLSSLTVTNAIVNGTTAKLGSNATTIANNNFTQFGLVAGDNMLYIYPSTDSLKPYYNNTIQTNSGEIYSLFLAGTTTTTVDAILVKDDIPYRPDSTAGIRIINLSPNSAPLNITLSTSPTVNEFTGLGYKQITAFKTYPALSTNSTYIFQVRDGVTNALLTSISVATPRFANVTLVIRGLVGGTPAIGVTRVNNY